MRRITSSPARLRLLLCLLACTASACDAGSPAERGGPVIDSPAAEEITRLEHSLLPEASGLAVSRRTAQRFWFINDSGNAPELIALDMPGRRFRVSTVLDVANDDWEDLESFSLGGEPWLVIADIGDNRARRDAVRLHFLPEPEPASEVVHVHTTLTLTYPDGARDAEAVAVDPGTQSIYVLSKRDTPPRLYRAPLPELARTATVEGVLEALGAVTRIPGPTARELREDPRLGPFRAQPTAMSLSPDGSFVALLTYRGVYRATLAADRDWLRALNETLCSVAPVDLKQAESVAVDDENRILVTSERRKAPLLRFAPACSSSLY